MRSVSDTDISKPVGFIRPKSDAGPVFGAGLETKEDAEEKAAKKKETDDIVKLASEALSEVKEEMRQEGEDPDATRLDSPVDVDAGVEDDPQLLAAREAVSRDESRPREADSKGAMSAVEISKSEKEAFLDAIVTGGRYRWSTTLFGGRVYLGLRARTVAEVEAIDSYIRRLINDKRIVVGSEYADVMRLCLLVAGVERLGEERFPEMGEKDLIATVGPDGVRTPAWVDMLGVWRSKPEGLVNAILPELFKFEAKYAEMVRRGSDENFWKTAESTGE